MTLLLRVLGCDYSKKRNDYCPLSKDYWYPPTFLKKNRPMDGFDPSKPVSIIFWSKLYWQWQRCVWPVWFHLPGILQLQQKFLQDLHREGNRKVSKWVIFHMPRGQRRKRHSIRLDWHVDWGSGVFLNTDPYPQGGFQSEPKANQEHRRIKLLSL